MKKIVIIIFCFCILGVVWWQFHQEDFDQTVQNVEAKKSRPKLENSKNIVKKTARSVASDSKIDNVISKANLSIKDKKIDAKSAVTFNEKDRSPSSLGKYFDQETVSIDGQEFQVSESLRTLPMESFEIGLGKEIARKGGYVFFESNDNGLGQPALYHQNNRAAVVLTGRVLLKNVSKARAEQIASSRQVQLDSSMSHLGVYAFQASNNVLQAISELGQGISAPEIIEGHIHEK